MGVPAFRWGSEFWQFPEARVHPVQAEFVRAAWFLGIPAGIFEDKPSRRVRTPGQPAVSPSGRRNLRLALAVRPGRVWSCY